MGPQRRTYYGSRWYIAWQLKRDVQRMATQGYTTASDSECQHRDNDRPTNHASPPVEGTRWKPKCNGDLRGYNPELFTSILRSLSKPLWTRH